MARLPDEDLGPAWLRDWQHIDADIQAMDEFAKKLRTDVEANYAAHLSPIYDDMATAVPGGGFAELQDLLVTHRDATQTTTNFVHDYANRSAHMADAASQISQRYGDSDAFASATVNGVNQALGASGAAAPNTGDTQPGSQPGSPPGSQPGSPPSGGSTEGATIPTTEGY
jgi:hypothetical protein